MASYKYEVVGADGKTKNWHHRGHEHGSRFGRTQIRR